MPNPVAAAAAGTWYVARQDSGGGWNEDPSRLVIGLDGSVTHDNVPIRNAVLGLDGIGWPADGNPFALTATLVGASDDPAFWPNGVTLGPVLQGTIADAGSSGPVPFRANRAGVKTDMCWLMSYASGAFLNFYPGMAMSPFSTTDSGLIWRPVLNTIQTYNYNLLLFLNQPPVAGGIVQTMYWESAIPGLFWDIRQTSIIPEGAPDLRLVPDPPTRGATVATASEDPQQAWLLGRELFYFVDDQGRSLTNARGTLVATAVPESDFQRRWLVVGGFIVSAIDGSFIGVADRQQQPGAAVLLGAYQGAGAGQWLVRGSSVAPLQQPKLLLTAGGNGALTLQPGGAPGQAFKVQSAGGPGQFT